MNKTFSFMLQSQTQSKLFSASSWRRQSHSSYRQFCYLEWCPPRPPCATWCGVSGGRCPCNAEWRSSSRGPEFLSRCSPRPLLSGELKWKVKRMKWKVKRMKWKVKRMKWKSETNEMWSEWKVKQMKSESNEMKSEANEKWSEWNEKFSRIVSETNGTLWENYELMHG